MVKGERGEGQRGVKGVIRWEGKYYFKFVIIYL